MHDDRQLLLAAAKHAAIYGKMGTLFVVRMQQGIIDYNTLQFRVVADFSGSGITCDALLKSVNKSRALISEYSSQISIYCFWSNPRWCRSQAVNLTGGGGY
jgi:hypothetical protein